MIWTRTFHKHNDIKNLSLINVATYVASGPGDSSGHQESGGDDEGLHDVCDSGVGATLGPGPGWRESYVARKSEPALHKSGTLNHHSGAWSGESETTSDVGPSIHTQY